MREGMALLLKFSAVLATATVSGAVAVPLGIFAGLNPAAVLVISSAAAIAMAWGLSFGSERARSALMARFGRSGKAAGRTSRIADRFGPIGLGLIGPLFPGVVVTSLSAPALGMDRRQVSIWLTVGVVAWFSIFTAFWWLVRAGLLR
jgi:hypothetical protein